MASRRHSVTARARRAALAAAVLAASAAAAPAQQKLSLAPRYAPGRYAVTADWRTTQTTTLAGAPQPPQHFAQTLDAELTVAPPGAGGRQVVRMQVRRIRHEGRDGPRTLRYDSAGPPADQPPDLARALGLLLNADIRLTVGGDGTVTAASGLDAIWDEAARRRLLTDAAAAQMKRRLGDAAVAAIFRGGAGLLPGKAVVIGETWTREADLPVGAGRLPYRAACTLDSVVERDGRRLARVTFTAEAALAGPADWTAAGVTARLTSFRIRQEDGELLFDVATGLVARTTYKQTANMDLTVTSPDGQQLPLKINQLLRATVTARRQAAESAGGTP